MFKTRKSRPDLTQAARTFTSTDVARIAAVSLRQLQWWDERKVVSPHHEGHRRVYLAEEVVEITADCGAAAKGVLAAEDPAACCASCSARWASALAEVLSGNSNLHLLTDGKSIFLEDQHERIIDLLKNARQPMFLVSVSDQVGAARRDPPQIGTQRDDAGPACTRRCVGA